MQSKTAILNPLTFKIRRKALAKLWFVRKKYAAKVI
jgi:hypothetical protein